MQQAKLATNVSSQLSPRPLLTPARRRRRRPPGRIALILSYDVLTGAWLVFAAVKIVGGHPVYAIMAAFYVALAVGWQWLLRINRERQRHGWLSPVSVREWVILALNVCAFVIIAVIL